MFLAVGCCEKSGGLSIYIEVAAKERKCSTQSANNGLQKIWKPNNGLRSTFFRHTSTVVADACLKRVVQKKERWNIYANAFSYAWASFLTCLNTFAKTEHLLTGFGGTLTKNLRFEMHAAADAYSDLRYHAVVRIFILIHTEPSTTQWKRSAQTNESCPFRITWVFSAKIWKKLKKITGGGSSIVLMCVWEIFSNGQGSKLTQKYNPRRCDQ